MLKRIDTCAYNERRYGKPWIEKIDFSINKNGDYKWGDWIGEPGQSGLLEIKIEIGDVIAKGQKDNRNPRNSAPNFYIVDSNFELIATSKKDAYLHFEKMSTQEKVA